MTATSTALAVQLVAAHRGLIAAHEAAEAFHAAMARALSAQADIERDTAEFGNADVYWTTIYQTALGQAAAALQKMPAKWAALLTIDLEQP